jgi:hypothetical protein
MNRVRRSITAQFTVTFALVSAVVVAGFVVMILTARRQGWGAQTRRGIGNLSAAEASGHPKSR